MFLLEIKLGFDSKEQAKRFFDSIKADLFDMQRSATKIAQRKEVIEVKITAADKTALRASLNSILKPLMMFEKTELLD